jgi:hypothetical protein
MADDTAYFMWRKPGIHRQRRIAQPELGLHIAATDVGHAPVRGLR